MLSGDDREWLEEKFSRVHDRIDIVESKLERKGSDIHDLNAELIKLTASECKDVKDHEERYHNPAKTWGIMASMVGVVAGIIEGLKWLLKRGGA